MKYLVSLLTLIVLYITGMLMSLFGPSAGRWLGIFAFVGTWTIGVILVSKNQNGTLRCLAEDYKFCHRFRPVVRISMILCILITVASIFTTFASSAGAGITDGPDPVFDMQDEYRLNNHGRETTVTRERYLIVGSSFVIGWHTFGILFALIGLHLILFGDWPLQTKENQRNS